MSFTAFSKEFTANMFTSVENRFIAYYVPQANGDAVRVYLYGLYLCQCSAEFDAESAAKLLGLTPKKLLEIFDFWEECDLVHILSREPLFVEYLPVSSTVGKPKRIRPEKYAEFNREFYKLLQKAGKEFKPYEMQKILEFLENNPMEHRAFLLVCEYCAKKDGDKLTSSHILNKATQLCREHRFTYEQVEQALADYNSHEKELADAVFSVAKRLGIKVQNPFPYCEEYAEKWLERGYDVESLSLLAGLGLKLGYGFPELDTLLDKLYAEGVVDSAGVAEYCKARNAELKLLQRIQAVCGIIKKTQSALDMLAAWRSWNFSDAMILEAAKRSAGAAVPLPYMNKLLSEWKRANVFTPSDIPEKASAQPARSEYRSEAAIAADKRGEREHYYAVLRQNAIAKADAAQKKAEKDVRFREANATIKKGEIELAKAEVFAPETVPAITEQIERARAIRERVLAEIGLTEADLLPSFQCTKCSDTGFLPDGRMCDCYHG